MIAEPKKKRPFEGLWIPDHVRNIPRSIINPLDREIYAHIYSFGEKGCYESNETIGRKFMVSSRTVSRRIKAIGRAGLVYIKCPKGFYRTIWAKSHPNVQAAVRLRYRNKEIPKSEAESGHKTSPSLRQDCLSDCDKVGEVTATNQVFPLRQNCLTTNTYTYKETYKETSAADLTLPAGGQASRLLKERPKHQSQIAERLIAGIGKTKAAYTPLTEKQFEERKQKILAQLRTSEPAAEKNL